MGAFVVALFGSTHCLGMCGGLAAALSLGLPPERRHGSAALPFLLTYNIGRIASYVIAGAAVGALGASVVDFSSLQRTQQGLLLISGLFMIALGLYLAGWWLGLRHLERGGGLIWRYLAPLAQRLVPVRNLKQALLAGLVWGWLPCGLVYSVLVWALSSADPLDGALLMLAFGLGTLPTLLAAGLSATSLAGLLRSPQTRQWAGSGVIALGLWQCAQALL